MHNNDENIANSYNDKHTLVTANERLKLQKKYGNEAAILLECY